MSRGIGGRLIGDVELLLSTQVIRSRSLFRISGPSSQCWRAEQELEAMYPGSRCLLVPSATLAQSMLLELLGTEPGREVLISPYGWVSNWSVIRRAGLRHRFLPLDDALQVTPEAVAARITDRTAAVVIVHLLGRGQQRVEEIAQVCDERGVPLLEDIAQSFGVSVGGRRAGTFGTGAWASLNDHKIVSTGDGGFALTRDEAMFARLTARHDQGCMLVEGKRRPHPDLEPGISLRVSELTAAVLRAQVARFNLVRTRVLALHEVLARSCADDLGLDVLDPSQGDIPYTVLFRRPDGSRYPSLLDSNWHVASQVPWLEQEFTEAAADDHELLPTLERLRSTSALGAGFVDPYLGIPVGSSITDLPDQAPETIRRLEELL